MPLGIKPTVDFAFKKIFGSPENVAALIGLLNAILCLKRPIASVEILNPFNYQDFAEGKLIVLDVRCCDLDGRMFNVEMQVSVYGGLTERMVYYACSMYVDQLSAGDNYATLSPSISICLLNQPLFRDTSQAHHRFQMRDSASGRELDNAIEVHTVELLKYNLDVNSITAATKLEQWAFLLLRAQNYDAATLRRLLPGLEFETAIQTIEIISAKTEDKQMYDQREKAQRDYEWALSGAREEGREEGLEEGRDEGLKEGELLGLAKGKLVGQIQLLQQLLEYPQGSDEELHRLSLPVLETQLVQLQMRLRERPA